MWQMWSGLIAPATCDDIIEVAMQRAPRDAAVGLDRRVDQDYRDSEVRFLGFGDLDANGLHQWRHLFAEIKYYAEWANANAFGADINFMRDLQFATYREQRQQHFAWHRDTFWINPTQMSQRKLTTIIQLSDADTYTGCDLELEVDQRPCPMELRKRGTLIVFPSFVWHRVTPIVKGIRHSLVSWYDGPAWR